MKKLTTSSFSKLVLLFVFIGAQMKSWALDTGTSEGVNKASVFFSTPSVWIAIGLLIACILGVIFIGNSKNQPAE